MAYSTQADLLDQTDEDVLIQLTDDDDAGLVDSDIVVRAINDADAEIDTYCGTRYSVPFTTVTSMIRKLSVDIALYNLFARRRGAPDDRKERYNNAIRFLRDISRGINSLGAESPTPDDDGGPETTTSKDDRIFTMTSMDNF